MLPGERSPWTTPLLVGVGEGRGHGRDRGDHLAGPQPAPPGQQRGEAAARQQLEDQRHARRRRPRRGWCTTSMQPDQVRVVERPEQRRLPRLPLRVAGDQHLDRHRRRHPAAGTARQTSPGAAPPSRLLERVAGHHGRLRRGGRRLRTCRGP